MSKQTENSAANLTAVLFPLLDILGWDGDHRTMLEARPYLVQEFDEFGLQNCMANLGFITEKTRGVLSKIDHRLLPTLFLADSGEAYVIINSENERYFVFNGSSGTYCEIEPTDQRGSFFFFTKESSGEQTLHEPQKGWLSHLFTRFRILIILLLFLSLALTFTALLTPLTIMGIYSIIGGADSLRSLMVLGIGIIIFTAVDFGFRWIRFDLLNYAASRINNIVSNQVLRRILYLPPSFTETASLGSQISRIRDFNTLRAFIEGNGINSLLEFPFFIVLFIALILIGKELAYIPAIAGVLLIVFGFFIYPWVRKINEESSSNVSKKQEFTIEFLNAFDCIRFAGASELWKKRYEQISANAAVSSYHTANINALINNVSQGVVSLAGGLTITIGVLGVIDGSVTTGALLGSMILVWRILAPIKTGFSVFSQSVRLKKSMAQLDRLMGMPFEQNTHQSRGLAEQIKGRIRLMNISLRYNTESAPALLGVNLDIEAGESVAITGHDGAGKSTLIKLILGMYKPQAGRVLVDHINIQQLNPMAIRRAIAYAPQDCHLFFGTIAQNLRLADPTASDDRVAEAAKLAGLYDEVMAMPKQFSERIGDQFSKKISSSFMRKITLARAFILNSPILLLDEPERGLSPTEIETLADSIRSLNGEKTVLLVTNNPQLAAAATRKIILDRGKIQE